MGLRRQILGIRGLSFGPESTNFGLERVDLGPERGQGGMYGQTYGRTNVWKFTAVSYSTSALWGCCPKRKGNERKRNEEGKEEKQVA